MIRLFVGVPLPAPVCQRLSAIAGGLDGARWVDVGNLHITVRFIGEVEESDGDDIDAALRSVRHAPFAIAVDGLDTFASGRAVRVLWAAVTPTAGMARLRDRVESALVRAGLEAEGRKYTPHITLARFKRARPAAVGAFIEDMGEVASDPFTVDHFTLFESRLGRAGAAYSSLAEYPLRGD